MPGCDRLWSLENRTGSGKRRMAKVGSNVLVVAS